MSAFDSVDALKSAIRESIESYDASRHTRTRERGRAMTSETLTERIDRLYNEGAGLRAILAETGTEPETIKLIAYRLGLSTKPGTKLDYAVIEARKEHDRKLGAKMRAKREGNRVAEPRTETKLAQATAKVPETIWETWDEISAAIRETVETWNTETLLYLASVEGNDLVSAAAAHELEVREALGDES